jgi:hypothetical protein
MPRQINAQRQACTRSGADAIEVPALSIGAARPPGSLGVVLPRPAPHMTGARLEIIQNGTQVMFQRGPLRSTHGPRRSWLIFLLPRDTPKGK